MRDLPIFMISYISLFEIVSVVVPDLRIFFWIIASVAAIPAVNPNGGKTLLARDVSKFFIEEVFVIKKLKDTVSSTYIINNIDGKKMVGLFYEKELQKTNQKELRIEKVIKIKGDKIYVKWKGHDNSYNSWIDKKLIL